MYDHYPGGRGRQDLMYHHKRLTASYGSRKERHPLGGQVSDCGGGAYRCVGEDYVGSSR